MSYHPADPMILLFNPIEKLKKMATAAEISYTTEQLLDIGLTVIRNTRDFERALGDWETLTAGDKTWDRFKSHFKEAQKQLRAIRGPTMQQAGYHHANHLASQLREDIEKRDTELFSVIQSAMETASQAPSLAPSDISLVTPPVHQHANAVQGDPVQLEMLKILQQIQQTMTTTTSQPTQQGRGGRQGQGRRTPRKTPDDASFNRFKTDKYCWTHGGCSHTSSECNMRAPGHQDSATFENKQGGSKAFCPS